MKKTLLSLLIVASSAICGAANAIVISSGSNVSDTCYPFGCAAGSGEYQQAYGIAQFPNALTISGIRLFGASYPSWVNGSQVSQGNFTITLSSSQKFGFPMSDNIGFNSVVVFDGALPSLDSSGNLTILFSNPFTYVPDPKKDLDLLMDVKWTDATSAARPVYFVTDDASWSESSAPFFINYDGPVTEFIETPEPQSVALMLAGLVGFCVVRRKRA